MAKTETPNNLEKAVAFAKDLAMASLGVQARIVETVSKAADERSEKNTALFNELVARGKKVQQEIDAYDLVKELGLEEQKAELETNIEKLKERFGPAKA